MFYRVTYVYTGRWRVRARDASAAVARSLAGPSLIAAILLASPYLLLVVSVHRLELIRGARRRRAGPVGPGWHGCRCSSRVLALRAAARLAAETAHDRIPAKCAHCPPADCVEGTLPGRACGSAKPRRVRAVPSSTDDDGALPRRSPGSCTTEAAQTIVGSGPSWLRQRHAELVRETHYTRFQCGIPADTTSFTAVHSIVFAIGVILQAGGVRGHPLRFIGAGGCVGPNWSAGGSCWYPCFCMCSLSC